MFIIMVLCTWEICLLRCSLICKWTFGSENIEYNKTFAETLGSFVNVFGCDCYASCLDISVDLACKQLFFWEAVLIYCRVANRLEKIAKASYIILWTNRSSSGNFQLLLCALDISLLMKYVSYLFHPWTNLIRSLILQVGRRGCTSFIGRFSSVSCRSCSEL